MWFLIVPIPDLCLLLYFVEMGVIGWILSSFAHLHFKERSGSIVGCLARNIGVASSSITGVIAL